MSWYWYWILYIAAGGALFYGVFYGMTALQKRFNIEALKKSNPEDEAPSSQDSEDPQKQCPVCQNPMEKDTINGIIVDRCVIHGVWFDTGELEALLNFAKSGGSVSTPNVTS